MRGVWITAALSLSWLSGALNTASDQLSPGSDPDTSRDNIRSLNVYYEFIRPQSSSHGGKSALASINYNTSSHEGNVTSYTPPTTDDSVLTLDTTHPLVRISTDSSIGSTSVTSLAAFHPAQGQILSLHLNDESISFAASMAVDPLGVTSSGSSTSSISTQQTSRLKLEFIPSRHGPSPKLVPRKPVVVDPEGKEVPEETVPEKTFFQKYWWALALVGVLALSGGGDK